MYLKVHGGRPSVCVSLTSHTCNFLTFYCQLFSSISFMKVVLDSAASYKYNLFSKPVHHLMTLFCLNSLFWLSHDPCDLLLMWKQYSFICSAVYVNSFSAHIFAVDMMNTFLALCWKQKLESVLGRKSGPQFTQGSEEGRLWVTMHTGNRGLPPVW